MANQSKSPDRYIIANNLVVNLAGTPANEMNQTQYHVAGNTSVNMSNASSHGGKIITNKVQGGSIFPSTTTATTANSLTEKH